MISDRYIDSSLAYQGAGRTLPVEEVSWLSSWATGGLKPDLVVLLDIEPQTGLRRAEGRGAGADRLEGESLAFHERVRYAFLDLAASDPKRYLVLDASRPAAELEAEVLTRSEALTGRPDPASAAGGPAAGGPAAGAENSAAVSAAAAGPPSEDVEAGRRP